MAMLWPSVPQRLKPLLVTQEGDGTAEAVPLLVGGLEGKVFGRAESRSCRRSRHERATRLVGHPLASEAESAEGGGDHGVIMRAVLSLPCFLSLSSS